MKIKDPALFRTIKSYLAQYLPVVRKKSINTVSANRTALNLFLEYLSYKKGISLSAVTTKDFTADAIIAFSEWLKDNRQNAPTTINQRVTCIRQFCKYLLKNNLITYADYAEVQEIAKVKDTRKQEMIYLSVEETTYVLSLPNVDKRLGLRDKFFLSLMYDSGCRDQEMLDLKVDDLREGKDGSGELHIIGKGKKYRVTPISKEVVQLYKQYCKEFHTKRDPEQWLFFTNRRGVVTQMSADNVARFMKQYEEMAKDKMSRIPHLHPHLFRHTRAMHLYIAGVPLPLISEWLGHSQLETTQIYAKATTDMKRKAAEKFHESNKHVFSDEEFKYADDEDAMKKLYGLA